jgi:hypothetical protein
MLAMNASNPSGAPSSPPFLQRVSALRLQPTVHEHCDSDSPAQ